VDLAEKKIPEAYFTSSSSFSFFFSPFSETNGAQFKLKEFKKTSKKRIESCFL